MNGRNKIFYLTLLLCGLLTPAYAQEKHNVMRGQILYTTHCNVCHTAQIHWREQKLVKDWDSLVSQVRRWQLVTGLSWSEDEINDVAFY